MANDIVQRAMSFIFEPDQKHLRQTLIALLEKHTNTEPGKPPIEIQNLAVRYQDAIWSHPDRGRQARGMIPLTTVNVLPEYEEMAKAYLEDSRLLEKDSKRALKTLTQLVRGLNTDEDLRDSLPDCITLKLGFNHLERTREPGFRYKDMEPRLYANIQKDIEMIEGYFNARLFYS